MTTIDENQPRPHAKRRTYVVHSRLQWAVALQLLGVLAAVALLYLGSILLLGRYIRLLNPEETRLLYVSFNDLYWTLAMVMITGVALYQTHHVAGPAQVIERAVRALQDGDYDQRLTLRPRDYLMSLAEAVSNLSSHMREQNECRRQLLQELSTPRTQLTLGFATLRRAGEPRLRGRRPRGATTDSPSRPCRGSPQSPSGIRRARSAPSH